MCTKSNIYITKLIVLLFIVCIFNKKFISFAANEKDFIYMFVNNNTELEIAGYNGNSLEVVIPCVINDMKVTSIGNNAFKGCTNITGITIPDSINKIGNYAFEDCKNLKSIYIPASINSIGSGIFGNCESLSSVIVDSNNTKYDSRNSCN